MHKPKWDEQTLHHIISEMVHAVTESKNQIFEIGEKSRNEYGEIIKELADVRERMTQTTERDGQLERQARFTRARLAEVSKHFQSFGQEEIREAYEQANQIQIELSVTHETEKQLHEKRKDLERRLTGLQETVEKAEGLTGQVSVVLDYLNRDLRQIGEVVKDARQKQDFGLKIIEAQEEERLRLSREIHDGPAQTLAQVLLGSELVGQVCQKQGEAAAFEELGNLQGMIRSALSDVRRIIYDLRPMTLDDLGLVPTLEKYVARIEEAEGVTISFEYADMPRRLSSKMETALFRLVQEAVQNACKHGEPGAIQIKIDFRDDAVMLVIKDDGKGFDLNQEKEDAFGIIGMRERVDLLEGEITFDSKLGQGTIVMIQIPVREQGDFTWQTSAR